MAQTDDNETGFDPKRRLCPDGDCIGVIGSDGKCTICGRLAAGDVTTPAWPADSDDQGEVADEELPGQEPGEQRAGFNPNRRLCSDEACIGVIGEDNRCSECGKPGEG
jgi:hypothetical protein